ncbi:hypothetical protein ASPCAL15069 [Aspergillus calidoustus]|uniref:Uncharacterized protein n=1 Tax=Aspergillus calidoustus TaxID=454130 RepID=A0A0U5GKM7_ASPCI|nr:hypothetical protein ASPCAL15069 [Aspergillus calidoustus]
MWFVLLPSKMIIIAKPVSKGCCSKDSDRRMARKAPSGSGPRLTRAPPTSNTIQYCPATRETVNRGAGDRMA